MHLSPVLPTQKHILRHLLELYCYDFSEYLGTDVNENGLFGYTYLDAYFEEVDRHAYFIKVADKFVGFVLLNRHFELLQDPSGYAVAEFFVLRKYRRKGIGMQAAKAIFDLYPGAWEVSQMMANMAAVEFWLKVVDEYTNGVFSRKYLEQNGMKQQVLLFEKGSPS